MLENPTASLCIVTYNNASGIVKSLESIYANSDINRLKVYIVDNNSTDNTADIVGERFPQAVLVRNKDNKGFGHGHNCVLDMLSSDYHFIVNPDIISFMFICTLYFDNIFSVNFSKISLLNSLIFETGKNGNSSILNSIFLIFMILFCKNYYIDFFIEL